MKEEIQLSVKRIICTGCEIRTAFVEGPDLVNGIQQKYVKMYCSWVKIQK